MHYKTNRLNHDFQLAYFLAGSCKTPDAAWSLLCDQAEDRETALKTVRAGQLREKAKRLKAEAIIASDAPEWEKLEAEADVVELDAMMEMNQRNIAGAEAELAMIHKLQARLEPLRKYAHLPAAEAHEAAQAEEWKLELIYRAENFMLTQGAIPADHFDTMRMHPAFKTEIFPAIETLNRRVEEAKRNKQSLISVLPDAPEYLPKMLAAPTGE